MARTVRQLAAWGIAMAFAMSGGSHFSRSQGLAQDELGVELDGKKLFEKETFGGNGRTCRTCHSKDTGTLTLADVQRITDKADPDDKLLIGDALDEDGVGTTRVRAHATIRYTVPLPPWISMADDPGATDVSVFRGIPSTRNTPALDPVLLHDGRAPTLQEQARGAIHDHYQNTVEPTTAQLDAIAEFQRTDEHFFSSPELRRFAVTGSPPELPPGIMPAERRGRSFFVDAPFAPPSKNGICALCHSGPMLNMVNQAHSDFGGGRPRVEFKETVGGPAAHALMGEAPSRSAANAPCFCPPASDRRAPTAFARRHSCSACGRMCRAADGRPFAQLREGGTR